MNNEAYNQLTQTIKQCCIKVHKYIGPGLLESVYEACLAKELKLSNINFKSQLYLPVEYYGEKLDINFRIDFLIEDAIILE